jgi:hypothetical protein
VNTPSASDTVDGFLQAIGDRDFEKAATYLDHERFEYTGPTMAHANAAAFIADISRFGPILEGIERRKTFRDGNEICVILNFISSMPLLNKTRIAQWFRVADGKIIAIESFLDAYSYMKLFDAELPLDDT